ncbi:hypothetical protein O9G_006403, partial [Rozella allomycis CSF55]
MISNVDNLKSSIKSYSTSFKTMFHCHPFRKSATRVDKFKTMDIHEWNKFVQDIERIIQSQNKSFSETIETLKTIVEEIFKDKTNKGQQKEKMDQQEENIDQQTQEEVRIQNNSETGECEFVIPSNLSV